MAIQIISLSIALLAVIVGPIITYKITKKNLEFQFRTMTQEKWINKLEDAGYSFLIHTAQWVEKYPGLMKRHGENSISTKEVNAEIDLMLDSINASLIKLQFYLDASKPVQNEIWDNALDMKKLIMRQEHDRDTIESLNKYQDTIIEKLQSIFQSERKKIAKIYQ